MFTIYLLRDEEGVPLYVGQTNDPKRREGEHQRRFHDPVKMEILEQCATRDRANQQEQIYIRKYRTDIIGWNQREGGGVALPLDEKIQIRNRARTEKAKATRLSRKPTNSEQNTLYPEEK